MIKTTAIRVLYPQVVVTRGDGAFDEAGNQVIYDEAAVQAYIDANSYKDKRAKAYPSIADQLDTIYHEGIDAWKETISAVKAEYPKGV